MAKKYLLIFIIVALILTILAFVFLPKKDTYSKIEKVDIVTTQDYVGSHSCKECHVQEYAEWELSDHFKAMQHADDKTVLGDFNDVTYTADGITSRFFKKDGKFYINTEDENGKYRDFEIVFTFGHYPLQQYLTKFDGGKMQVFRQSWDSRENKWFHQYAGEKIPSGDYLHWTNAGQNWNLMCSTCHSTNLQKNYNPLEDTYKTTYDELTVGCESCHGPGKKHNYFMLSSDYQKGISKNFFINLGVNTPQKTELNTCMPCHARRGEVTQHHTPSDEIMDNYIPEIPITNIYFADGQALDEVYKYGSFLQSKMYHVSIKCTNCHLPHSGKLRIQGNQLCLQCHTPNYATSAHTFHKENTEASDCKSCHMPTRTYMGNDIRHDHNFAVPRPDLSEKYGVPNACNTCHNDKSAKWASQAVEKWYGKERRPHFAENLIIGSLQNEKSLERLNELLTNSATPDIIRATAVHYLGGIYTEQSLQLVKKELNSSDAQTRYRAVIALGNFPIHLYENELIPLLNDKVKAVRIATAYVFLSQKGWEQSKLLASFESARKEYETFVLSQADFPVGSATAADYFTHLGDTDKAILFYERAIKKDKTLNHVRLNLATLYNGKGQNNKAWQILHQAQNYAPQNAQVYYFMALLSSEEKDYNQAKKYFEKAMQLGMNNENIQRNYQSVIQIINKKN